MPSLEAIRFKLSTRMASRTAPGARRATPGVCGPLARDGRRRGLTRGSKRCALDGPPPESRPAPGGGRHGA